MYARLNLMGPVGLVGIHMALTHSRPTDLHLPAGWWGAPPMQDHTVVSRYGLSAAGGLAVAGILAPWTHELSWRMPRRARVIVGAVAWIAATVIAVAHVRWAASFGFERNQRNYAGTHEYRMFYGVANAACIGILWGVWARQRVIPALLACSASAVVVGVAVAVLAVDAPTNLSASVPLVFGVGPVAVQVIVPVVLAGVVFVVGQLAQKARHGQAVAWAALAAGVVLWVSAGIMRPGAFPMGVLRGETRTGVFPDFSAVSVAPVWMPVEWLEVVTVGLMLAGPVISRSIAARADGLDIYGRR
ncbi:hypothetical protein OS123_02095 [Corynebacterium sp. P5875]|uniref:Uncharacterized protein n=1 Tax=Corynebacterium antarcticum TaxID=2800405 RepID=A0A9Q4GN26_9CORY|nr:hypothetical protein [Corynebacterium antarcticum]MCX7537339.1 hypothetical protein [Corynebacterium antarcticum]